MDSKIEYKNINKTDEGAKQYLTQEEVKKLITEKLERLKHQSEANKKFLAWKCRQATRAGKYHYKNTTNGRTEV